jgi:hypothetical protein
VRNTLAGSTLKISRRVKMVNSIWLPVGGSNARTVNEYLKKIRCNVTIKENVQEKKNI